MPAITDIILKKVREKADIGDDLRGVTVSFGNKTYSWERFEELYRDAPGFPEDADTITLHLCSEVSCADDSGNAYPTRDVTVQV